jgi:hypothetical protein
MPGITAISTSPIGNMGENQVHMAKSTLSVAVTIAPDTSRLQSNGGYYRPGDLVLLTAADGGYFGQVQSDGRISGPG